MIDWYWIPVIVVATLVIGLISLVVGLLLLSLKNWHMFG